MLASDPREEPNMPLSSAMQRFESDLTRVARIKRTTLIEGPTGSGKERTARRLHSLAHRARPFIAVHCGALPDSLVEAELFGHTSHAFTGAKGERIGLIRAAEGGTLFLDEIDSLSLSTQSKLLRFLDSGEVRAVGSDRVQHVDTWVLAATNADLAFRSSDGLFRQDLYYRLDMLRLRVPALRERLEDILPLARQFVATVNPKAQLSKEAEEALLRHTWPGNVRELRHRVEAAALVSEGPIQEEDLRLAPLPQGTATRHTSRASNFDEQLWSLVHTRGLSLGEAVQYCEATIIERALAKEDGNRTRAARRLGIHVRTMFKKLATDGRICP